MNKGTYKGTNRGHILGANYGLNKGLFKGTNNGFNLGTLIPQVLDFTSPTWTKNSFYFNGSNTIFTGDSTASTIVNNALVVPPTPQFDIVICCKRLVTGATQILFCRDNSSNTTQRQFAAFYSSANKFVFTLYGSSSTNTLSYSSTATFTETREYNVFRISYDANQSVLNRLTVRRNEVVEPGTVSQGGTFTTINSGSTANIEIGARSNVANFSNSRINYIALFNTNLSVADGEAMLNNNIPFDFRTNSALSSSLVLFLSSASANFSTNWSWTDLVGGSVFTSANMTIDSLVYDAPALKQITVILDEGQSNDTGREPLLSLPARFTGELRWIKVWNGTEMVYINSLLNNNQYVEIAGQYGIEFYLSELLNLYFRKTVYIFKVSKGASSLAYQGNSNNWRYPDGSQGSGGVMYRQLHNIDLPALKEWTLANGYTITKMPHIRMQGEADSQDLTDSNNYGTNTLAFLNHPSYGMHTLIKQLFGITPKFYDCLLANTQTNSGMVYKSVVNTEKINVQASDPTNYRIIQTDNSPTYAYDYAFVHFNDSGNQFIANNCFKAIKDDNYF